MNVAILFCGISYAKSGNHYRDFRKTFKSHDEFINKIKKSILFRFLHAHTQVNIVKKF